MRRISEADSPEIRQMMAETETCLCCGLRLKYHQRKDGRRNRGYCSLGCYYRKPPKMAYAERVWGKPIRELLCDLLNRQTVEATAHMLGVEKWTLIQWTKKLGIRRVVRWEVSGTGYHHLR